MYDSRRDAVRGLGRVKFEKDQVALYGPCPEQGVHIKVRQLDPPRVLHTITSCQCCYMSGGRPLLKERWSLSK